MLNFWIKCELKNYVRLILESKLDDVILSWRLNLEEITYLCKQLF